MTLRSGDAYPDFQAVSHQPTGFSRWSLSWASSRGHERALLAGSFRVVQPRPATDSDAALVRCDIRSDTSGRS
jgi:hypothetical protein